MIGGATHSYDIGGELPASPRQWQPPAVHMVDPFESAVLCGTSRNWHGTNDPSRVTCRSCLRVLKRRTRRAQEESATATK